MAIAIIICFEYNDEKNNSFLKGSNHDLINIILWCKKWNCECIVFTDIILNNKILKLIKYYKLIGYNDNLIDILNYQLNSIIKNEKKYLIYYSGHSYNNNLIIPLNKEINFITFRNIICENINVDSEIFIILDCCNPSGLQLPYYLKDNKFLLSSSSKTFIKQNILLITSSNNTEKSYSSINGSNFTNLLIKYISDINTIDNYNFSNNVFIKLKNNRNLDRLYKNLTSEIKSLYNGLLNSNNQTISIYSSYINDPILFLWIGCSSYNTLSIDSTFSCFKYNT